MGKKKTIMGFVVALFLTVCTVLSFTTSCGRINNHKHRFDRADSTKLAMAIDKELNPSFTSVDGFLIYSNQEIQYQDFVYISSSLSPQTRAAIAQKSIEDFGSVSWSSFLRVYDKHRDLYDSMERSIDRGQIKQSAYISPSEQDTIIEVERLKPIK